MMLSTILMLAIEEPSEASLYAAIAIAAVVIACFVGSVIHDSRRRFAIGGALFIATAFIIDLVHGEEVHRIRMANAEIEHKVRMHRLYRDGGLSEEEAAAQLAADEHPQKADSATPEQPPSTPRPRPRFVPRATPSPEDILRKYGTQAGR